MRKEFFIVSISILLFMSCRKGRDEYLVNSNIWIVNASINMTKAVVQDSFYSSSIDYNTSRLFQVERSILPFSIKDTANSVVYGDRFQLKSAAYTIFLTGQVSSPEVIIKDDKDLLFVPADRIYSSNDSVVNIRFINLSPNSVPLKIKLATTIANEVDNLPYKEISTWRPFKAIGTTTSYIFQIRNAATDALITSYTFTANAANRFKNVTLMIRGLQGTTTGTNAFGVTPITYF